MLRCARCSRADNTDPRLGCIDNQTIGCPVPLPVVPGKDIVLICRKEQCGKQFSLPAASLMRRTIPSGISCQLHPCEILATVVLPEEIATDAASKSPPKRKPRTE